MCIKQTKPVAFRSRKDNLSDIQLNVDQETSKDLQKANNILEYK